ncbi:MAG: IPTL-CTERM sorting domain-containing protein [Thiobacillus sp.]
MEPLVLEASVYTDLTPSGSSQPVNESWNKVALQTDGKILLYGGTAGGSEKVVVRYQQDGSLDTSFGIDGVMNLGAGNSGDIAVLTTGNILLTYVTANSKIKIIRLTLSGAIDNGFGVSGEVEFVTQYGGGNASITLGASGSFSIVGNIFDQQGNTGTFLAEYSSTGELQSTVMVASDTASAFSASQRDDQVFVGAKEKTIDGGLGIDSSVFDGVESDYVITKLPDAAALSLRTNKKMLTAKAVNSELSATFTVQHKTGLYGTKTINNFEFITFDDKSVNLNNLISSSGLCGAANGVASAFQPTQNLCSTGSASTVNSGASWSWTCPGTGGVSASCSAPKQSIPAGTGDGGVIVSGTNWTVNSARSSGFIPTSGDPKSPGSLPPGIEFPHGLLDFTLTGGAHGSAATIAITYPSAIPSGTTYWKYGPSPAGYNCSGAACATAHWYQMPPAQAVITGNTIMLTITDGGVGDDDLTANSVIVDQGGPGVSGGGIVGIPTLSEWALLALAVLIGLFGMGAMRRRSPL